MLVLVHLFCGPLLIIPSTEYLLTLTQTEARCTQYMHTLSTLIRAPPSYTLRQQRG